MRVEANRLAMTRGKGRGRASSEAALMWSTSATWLTFAFWRAWVSASGSISVAQIAADPSLAKAMAKVWEELNCLDGAAMMLDVKKPGELQQLWAIQGGMNGMFVPGQSAGGIDTRLGGRNQQCDRGRDVGRNGCVYAGFGGCNE